MEPKVLKDILGEGSVFYLVCDNVNHIFKKMTISFDGFNSLLEFESSGETVYFPMSKQGSNPVTKTDNGYSFELVDENGYEWDCVTDPRDL